MPSPVLKRDDAARRLVLDHECRLDRAGERTLVEVTVENETTVDRRVRVANRLDAPVEPPRESGAPAPGWDEDGWTGVVPANGRVTLGYACAAPLAEPAVAVTDQGRPDDESSEVTARDAVRLLGDGTPPVDAVPETSTRADPPAPVAAMADRLTEAESPTATADEASADRASADDATAPDEPSAARTEASAASRGPATTTDAVDASCAEAAVDSIPGPVASWIDEVTGRVDDAERVVSGDLATVAQVAEARGGAAATADLAEALAADERALRALAARAERLADRAANAEVPAEALRRLS